MYKKEDVKIQNITWQETLEIRHQVLWPDKPISFCKVEGDQSAIHYGAFIDEKLVCVASIYIDNQEARLRKFATLPKFQGKSIGTKVIEHAISNLKSLNINYFWCDARATALSFYQKFGLEIEGNEFKKSDISYYKMSVRF